MAQRGDVHTLRKIVNEKRPWDKIEEEVGWRIAMCESQGLKT